MSPTAAAVRIPHSMSISQAGPVVYRREDYVGAFRHLVIFAVDFLVILFVVFPLSLLPAVLRFSVTAAFDSFSIILPLFLAWIYLAVLKPSRIRSVGYWVTDVRIVTINGGKPSPFCMTLRLAATMLWLLLSPFGFFWLDLLWTTVDDERQMLRDLFSGTRLIRNNARPIGRGWIEYSFYTAFGLILFYPSVRRKVSEVINPPTDAILSSVECSTASSSTVEATTLTEINSATDKVHSREIRIVQCDICGMRVVPKSNGLCPSCQTRIPVEQKEDGEQEGHTAHQRDKTLSRCFFSTCSSPGRSLPRLCCRSYPQRLAKPVTAS